MKFGSLFAGIGGLDLGLERAGMTCAWQVEIDPYCQKVLAKHWPDVPRYGDIREVDPHALEPVDFICGGFPCQDISYAGNGAGLSGARSGLWREMVRTIRVVRPRFALVENVAALLDRGLGAVLGDLAESRYDAEWDCIPASAFGAYHERDRIFVVAHDQTQHGDPRRVLEEGKDRGPSLESRRVHSLALAERGKQAGARLDAEPRLDRLVHGLPDRMERLAALGNAVVPQVAEWIGARILAADSPQLSDPQGA